MGGAERTEQAAAISEGGLYVQTKYPQPQNARYAAPPLSARRGDQGKGVSCCTAIPRQTGPYKEPGMGMKFVEISDADRDAIRAYIREQLTGDILLFPK